MVYNGKCQFGKTEIFMGSCPLWQDFFCPRIEFLKGKHWDRGKSLAYLDILCTASRTSKPVHTSTFSSVRQEGHIRIYTITGAGYSQKSVSSFFFHCLDEPAWEQEHFWNPKKFPKEWKTASYSLHNTKNNKSNYIFFNVFLQDSRTVTSVTKSKISARKKFPGVGL